jgi:DNA-binding transcriptional MerR regulator
MIGHVSKGASFFHCISYCLEDKIKLTEEMKQQLAQVDHLQHKDRAEVLEYNLCFGDKYELAEQFRDVMKLSKRVEKPVLHLSLRLAPGDSLTREQWLEIGREAAKEFGVADHQYICVLHKDTKEQHIHIAANRVGFDGKVASDSNSYKRMAALCRRLEKQYNLKQVLSPRAFLSPEERRLPRHDQRKEKLKGDIRETLKEVNLFSEFQKRMQGLGYQVIKGRGISFIDDKKVKIKGSEVGFSLAKIEKILALKQELAAKQKQKFPGSPQEKTARVKNPDHRFSANPDQRSEPKAAPEIRTETMIVSLLSRLLEPEKEMGGGVPYELTEEYLKRKRKKPKISH